MLERLNELSLLKAIHPHLTWDKWIQDKLDSPLLLKIGSEWELTFENSHSNNKRDIIYILWMLRLKYGDTNNIIKRLKLSSELSKTILAARKLWSDLDALVDKLPSEVVKRLDGIPRLALYSLYIACEHPTIQKIIITYVTEWRNITPKTRGENLKAIGLPPGPIYRSILEALQTAWLDGVITTEKQEKDLLESLIAERVNSESSER
jgi:tRNA nucleotidyltransferase (CCA-adding enzyme)